MTKFSPHFSRMASQSSMANLARFSVLPPYSSVRLLNFGEVNWEIRFPCPPWTMTISIPARFILYAASANIRITSFIFSFDISSQGIGSLPSMRARISSSEEIKEEEE